jgi:hypothetical protein
LRCFGSTKVTYAVHQNITIATVGTVGLLKSIICLSRNSEANHLHVRSKLD